MGDKARLVENASTSRSGGEDNLEDILANPRDNPFSRGGKVGIGPSRVSETDPVLKFFWIRIRFQYPDPDPDPRHKSIQKVRTGSGQDRIRNPRSNWSNTIGVPPPSKKKSSFYFITYSVTLMM